MSVPIVTPRERQSPNHSWRGNTKIKWIVLHADVSPTEEATISWITSEASKVAYHMLVHRDGSLTRFVPDDRAAWACGASEWDGIHWLNRHTLSIAFSNRHNRAEYLTTAQIASAKRQIQAWRQKYPGIDRVLTHAMISPGRKSDPERIPNFDLAEYQMRGA